MQLMSFDGVMMSKIMTALYDGRHRAPHRSVRANHAVPTVVLKWTLSHHGVLCYLLI